MDNTLVAYFSRKGENFNVGNVSKGSGAIIADIAAELLGSREYEISTAAGYPEDLDECNKIAKKEAEENARPALKNALPDMGGIDNIVLVYPNWWGDLPMAVYSFLDGISTENLNIFPVCTHEDNGLAMTERMLKQAYPDAIIRKGVAIRGSIVQNDQNKTREILVKYLNSSNLMD